MTIAFDHLNISEKHGRTNQVLKECYSYLAQYVVISFTNLVNLFAKSCCKQDLPFLVETMYSCSQRQSDVAPKKLIGLMGNQENIQIHHCGLIYL